MVLIAAPFPEPPGGVRHAVYTLRTIRRGDADQIAVLGDVADLPRPWDPGTCPALLREQLWAWCDDVAVWINREYCWRPTAVIPACWPLHPHIAQELPGLAVARWLAGEEDTTPEAMALWHRETLPAFFARMLDRLGSAECRNHGRHEPSGATGRHEEFESSENAQARQRRFWEDTHPVTELHPRKQQPS